MTIELYLGTASEIADRLANGAPPTTTATITAFPTTDPNVLRLSDSSSFATGQTVVINREKRGIADKSGAVITLDRAMDHTPAIGDKVAIYDADYTAYRDPSQPLTFTDDIKTGGQTGNAFGNDIQILEHTPEQAAPVQGNRFLIVDSVDRATVLASGVIVSVTRSLMGVAGKQYYGWTVKGSGYTYEADALGIEEPPAYNVNAGVFLKGLLAKYTTLEIGEIDTSSSPRIDMVRLSSFRKFSDVGADLAGLWPGGEFFIENSHTNGKVYFRRHVETPAPITLNEALITELGPNNVKITADHTKVYNIVRFPFYKLTEREPDFYVQSIVSDDAFLKTSVVLSGQPASVEESQILFEDFSGGGLSEDWQQYDVNNPNPPAGFTIEDGYVVGGTVNTVTGLHMPDTSTAASPVQFGDLGCITDPAQVEPFTGAERQMLFLQEFVVIQPGECLLAGITDLSTRTASVLAGSTGADIIVDAPDIFHAGDRIEVADGKTYVTGVSGSVVSVSPSLATPNVGDVVSLHPLAKSRVQFGLLFKQSGALKFIRNGNELDFAIPRTYTAGPTTYSVRIFMQCFESTVQALPTPDLTSCTLVDSTGFASGDVVDLYTQGSRDKTPERRKININAGILVFDSTDKPIQSGYRVRTLPKIVVQIKGGEYGEITGRNWTTIHTEPNTWQTEAATARDDMGVVLAQNVNLVGTIPFVSLKDPIGVTAMVGGRYLHIGTQEIDSSEADTDCVLRKIGDHYQLDFFADTKNLWGSGSTLELRYQERYRFDLEQPDMQAVKAMAMARGFKLTGKESEAQLRRLGGRVLDTIQILPNPMTILEASNQANGITEAVNKAAVTAEIFANTYSYAVVKSGQLIKSELPGIPDLVVQQVQLTELPGTKNAPPGSGPEVDGATVFLMRILAGTVDRLADVLLQREIKNNKRLVIDDGYNDDSTTVLKQISFADSLTFKDEFAVTGCDSPTNVVFDGAAYTLLQCLKITAASEDSTPSALLLVLDD